jgi:hypothetical protein
VANLSEDDDDSLDVIADQTTIIAGYIRNPESIRKINAKQNQTPSQNLFRFYQPNPGTFLNKAKIIFSKFLSKIFQ